MYYKTLNQHNYIYYASLGLIGILTFFVQATELLPAVFGVRPLPLYAFIVCVAVFSNVTASFVFGLLAGVMMDMVSSVFDGFHVLALVVTAVVCSLLTEFLFNDRLVTTLVLCSGFTTLYYFIYWLCFIGTKGYPQAVLYLFRYSVLQIIYTVLFVFAFYYIIKYIRTVSSRSGEDRGFIK